MPLFLQRVTAHHERLWHWFTTRGLATTRPAAQQSDADRPLSVAIDHAALYVIDLDGSRTFFETYFGARSNDLYHNPRTGLRTYFLSFAGDACLEIMSRPGVQHARARGQLGWGHVAIRLGSRRAIDDLTQRLRDDGFRIAGSPRVTGDGYYEAVVLDPEGNEVELVG
ncbi:VOC family protein [Rothia uropygialis]|uniref:VOC family protein n=1 Tax=Kocuria sp. 36 TaxID=1415402 RepID=UPI001EE86A07|nr:VOC family protein [Kocuria sp. 36]